MKKIISVISVFLTVCILLSMNVFAEVKELSDIDPSTLVGKSVNELVSLNIIDGYTDGTFKPDNTVTRAEMAKLIVAFMGLDNIGLTATSTGFPDVDSTNHWSIPYVKIAVDQGIIVGYDDGTFKPDNTVKYSEAVKMVVCALGYGPLAANRTIAGQPWYSGYISVAAEKSILNGAATNSQESPASRGTVAVLLYNALDVPVAETSTQNGTTTVKQGDTTARDTYQKTEKVTGIVTGVYQTGLTKAETGLGKKFIEVTSGNTTKKYKVSSDIDTYALLGYKINANLESDSSDDDTLLSISKKDSKNIVNTINAKDIEKASANEISFWESESATKTTTITFESDASVIYNGRYLADPKAADFNIKAGTITTISNDGNPQADVIFINSYEIIAIRNIGTDSTTKRRKIYAMYGEGDVLIPNTGKFVKVVNSSGKLLEDPTTITAAKYDIANILRSKDGEVFELTVTKNKISGSITSIINDDSIAINNKTYNVAYNLDEYAGEDKPSLVISSNVIAYLDMFGNIAAADVTSATSTTNTYVGYMIYADKENGVSGVGKVRLFGLVNISGDRTYSLAAKTKIDGVTYSNYSNMLDALKNSAAKANVGKEDNGFTTTEYAQLIRFTLKNGEIDSIDTIEANETPVTDDLSLDVAYPYAAAADKDGLKYITGSKFQNSSNSTVMAINSSTKVLIIPKNFNEITKYKASSAGYFTTGSNRYRVEGYNLNSSGIASYVLLYGGYTGSTGSSLNEYSDIYLTKSISTTSGIVDGDEVMQDKFTGWNFKTGEVINDKRSNEEGLLSGKVENGEIFRFANDNNGLMEEVQMILEIDGDELIVFPTATRPNALAPVGSASAAKSARDVWYDSSSRQRDSSVCRLIYATALYVDPEGKSIKFTTTLRDDTCGILPTEYDYLNCNSALKIFVLDLTSNDKNIIMSEASIGDIVSVDDVGEDNASEASQVLMFYQSGSVRTILVIKQ